MMQMFTDIRPILLQYKEAIPFVIQAIIVALMTALENLSGNVTSKKQALVHYQELAYAATLLRYADVLYRMEHQQYFDILFDFYGMELDEQLSAWFEFGKTPGQMRLKQPIHEYTTAIWEHFSTAQKAHLKKSIKHLFFI
ncbi:MAG: hypothetical protein ACRCXC_11165 [Legionella sp.]